MASNQLGTVEILEYALVADKTLILVANVIK